MLRYVVPFISVVLLFSPLGCEKRPRAPRDTLHNLASLGDVNQVEALLAKGADVNARDQWRATPLHLAALQGHEEVVKLLLAKGADINAQDQYGGTPLHYAVGSRENEPVVRLLIESRANLNVVNREGQTPAAAVMNEGYDRTVDDPYPPSTYLRAMHHDCTEIARILVAAGADATIQLAAYVGDLDRIKSMLATGADVNARDKDGRTALHWAAVAGRKDVAVFLLDHGTDFNAREKGSDLTPLHEAARYGQTDVAEVLIAAGADLEAKTNHRATPLFLAAGSGHMAVMELLLTHGANANAESGGDRTLDRVACHGLLHENWWLEFDYKEMAELLLTNGAQINDDPEKATTVLIFAAKYGLKNLAEKVLAKGNAHINGRTLYVDYNKPLLTAISSGQMDVAELLVTAGADVTIRHDPSGDTALHMAARKGSEKMVRLLMAKGVKIDTQNGAGETPLHAAVVAGSLSMVEFLASHGAMVSAADVKGNTPLHYAARESRDMTELLISKGAVVNTANYDGDTPLHNAALRGHKEIVELLLTHGADAGASNRTGRTPQDLALRRGHMDVIEVLLKPATKK